MRRLPIIILLEEHRDHTVTTLQDAFVTYLKVIGYNSLCYEFPSCNNSAEVIKQLTDIRDGYESTLAIALNRCHQRDINVDRDCFLNMSFSKLCDFIKENGIEHEDLVDAMAAEISGLIPILQKLQVVKSFENSMDIMAIDLHTTPTTYEEEIANIPPRETHMVTRLEQLFHAGKNTIFIVGKLHAMGLSQRLESKGLLQNTLFLHLLSADSMLTTSPVLDNSLTTTNIPLQNELEFLAKSDVVHNITLSLHNSQNDFLNLFMNVGKLVNKYTIDESAAKIDYNKCKQKAFLIGYGLACAAAGAISSYALINQLYTQNDQLGAQSNTCTAFTWG